MLFRYCTGANENSCGKSSTKTLTMLWILSTINWGKVLMKFRNEISSNFEPIARQAIPDFCESFIADDLCLSLYQHCCRVLDKLLVKERGWHSEVHVKGFLKWTPVLQQFGILSSTPNLK